MQTASAPRGAACPRCNGKGRVHVGEKIVACHSCRGTGEAGGGKQPYSTK